MPAKDLSGLKVLVVDDDALIQQVVRATLTALGAEEIREAADGSAALRALEDYAADLVISDWFMAPMNGLEFLRRIRDPERSPTPDLPVIMVTAQVEMDRVIEARDAGATDFVAKPISPRDLGLRVLRVAARLRNPAGQTAARAGAPRRSASRGVGEDAYDEFRKKVQGTNINEQTLLSTDYLNHFNELIMLLEMVPDCPEAFEMTREWRPKSYREHFADGNLSYGALAISAYDHVPEKYLLPFEETVAQLNRLIEGGIAEVSRAVAGGDAEARRRTVAAVCEPVREALSTANAIIHGTVPVMDQDRIDSLFQG